MPMEPKSSSSLFSPLTGEERQIRLEEKFEHFWDSDDEVEKDNNAGRGSVSHWKVTTSSQWQVSKSPLAFRGKPKVKKSPRKSTQGSTTTRQSAKDLKGTDKLSDSLIESSHSSSKSVNKEHLKKSEESAFCIEEWSSSDEDENEALRKKASTQDHRENDCDNQRIQQGNVDHLEGFSAEDTERPKLGIPPTAAKVDFQLSSMDEKPVVVVPAVINQYLRDYQRNGIRFLYRHYVKKTGAILADDMGLGKTIQVIGFLAALMDKKGNHIDVARRLPQFIRQMSETVTVSSPEHECLPVLIVGPSSVMYNWMDELNTWGYFTVSKYHGAEKDACIKNVEKGKIEVVVTTFETFRDNVDRLNQITWELIIVDEVHKIKGLKAQVTQALRLIKTPCRYGLTGTVLQNNMTELWSIIDWAQPGVLGTLARFEMDFVQVIETGQRHDASKRELALARKQKDKFSHVRKGMMLRRSKALISEQLPKKEDLVVMCRLSELQLSVYKAILTHPDMEYVLKAEDPCDCHSGRQRASCCYKICPDGTKSWALVLSFMHLLLKTANHTALLIAGSETSEKQIERARSVCQLAFKHHPQFVELTKTAAFRTLSDPKYCGKMKILEGLLSVFAAKRDKVLLFSYSTKLLDIIEQYVACQGHEYRRIDGKVSSAKRMETVQQFNKDNNIFICLISTKAGGLGLNLTGANRVVIFDPNWNPSHDLQAQDRAYRIGQTRDVKVYRLVSAGTIEENVYLRQIYKQQLDEVAIGTGNAKRYFLGIQGDKDHKGELFGVKNMFTLRTGDACLTLDILKRNEKLERGLAGFDITHYVPSNAEPTQDSGEDEVVGDIDDESLETEDENVSHGPDDSDDDDFFREIFGTERDPVQKVGNEKMTVSPLQQKDESSIGECPAANTTNDGDNSDDGFPFLQRTYIKTLMDRASEDFGLPGTVSDITFSTANNFQTKEYSKPKLNTLRSRSNLSWLFPNDEDMNDDYVKGDDSSTLELPANKVSTMEGKTPPGNIRGKSTRTLELDSDVTMEVTDDTRRPSKQKSRISAIRRRNCPFTSVQSVLASEGVLHTHVNPYVVGSSKAEDHMTRCAIQDVFDLHTNTQAPAMQCEPYEESDEEIQQAKTKMKGKPSGKRVAKRKGEQDHNKVQCVKSGSFRILMGQTPATILGSQWQDLSKHHGMDQVALAEEVLQSTVSARLGMLRELYTHRHPQLLETLTKIFQCTEKDDPVTSGSHQKPKSGRVDKPVSPKNRYCGQQTTKQKTGVGTVIGNNAVPSPSKKLKTAEVSSLFCIRTLVAESQESVTSHELDLKESPSQNDSDGFTPVPPAHVMKLRSPAKLFPRKSHCRTRFHTVAPSSDKKKVNSSVVSNSANTLLVTKHNSSAFEPSFLPKSSVQQTVDGGAHGSTEHISDLIDAMGHQMSQELPSHGNLQEISKSKISPSNTKPISCSNDLSTKVISESSKPSNTGAVNQSENYKLLLDDIFQLSPEKDCVPVCEDEFKQSSHTKPSTSKFQTSEHRASNTWTELQDNQVLNNSYEKSSVSSVVEDSDNDNLSGDDLWGNSNLKD